MCCGSSTSVSRKNWLAPFERRVEPGEELLVAGELIMFPQVLAEPRAAGGPEAPGTVDRGGSPPEIGVVVGDPAAGPPLHLGGAGAGFGEILDHGHERLDALAQIGGFGRPVVHLGVDVDRVLAAPGRVQAVVPKALERGRLSALARGTDEQVAAVLEIQSGQPGIVAGGKAFDPLVGGKFGRGGRAQIEGHAAEEPLVLGHVDVATRNSRTIYFAEKDKARSDQGFRDRRWYRCISCSSWPQSISSTTDRLLGRRSFRSALRSFRPSATTRTPAANFNAPAMPCDGPLTPCNDKRIAA